MKIGILCAGDDEAAPFFSMIKNPVIQEKAMLKFYQGKIEGVDVVTLFSGVCKVNAAIAAQILIDTFQCTGILIAGTAGGMDPQLQLFDTVSASQCVYWDVAPDILTDFHPWMDSVYFQADEKLLKAIKAALTQKHPDTRVLFGTMATGERFIDTHMREEILQAFHPLCVDMETAAAAHVCYVNKIPWGAVRTITDTASHSGIDSFEENCKKASAITAEIVKNTLSVLSSEII